MTIRKPASDDDSLYAGNYELARLLRIFIRKKQREHLPRYKGRARVRNRISLSVRPSMPDRVQFTISLDIIEQWHAWNLHSMDPPTPMSDFSDLRLRVVRFRRMSTPLIILRLAEWEPKPYGGKLSRDKWLFSTSFKAADIGIDPTGGSIKSLEIIPWPALKGHIVVLPDTHRAYKKRRDDITDLLASIDPEEPPRFKWGRPDPEYAARKAAEAAERTNQ